MKLAARAGRIAPSPTLAMAATAKAMAARGIDVVDFSSGEPDFDTPEHIKQAAIEAAKAGGSMSAFIGEMLEARMGRGTDQAALLERFLSGAGYAGVAAGLPKRGALYERSSLHRHEHTDLRTRSERTGETASSSGFAEAGDQNPLTDTLPAEPD
mgnify:CR=1 FL=1